jgi:hypothetical protein
MKKAIFMKLILIGLLLIPTNLFADAKKTEWFGEWAMNHDGFAGTLRISDTKADCASSAWCDMAILYTDDKGVKHTGTIEKVDDKWQHMVFNINFPNNKQKFDAYIFSWDKSKLAGTTYWGGRTFGFFATRK